MSSDLQQCLPEAVMIFGCGYVGTALARNLQQTGVRVGALTRNVEKASELRALGLDEVIVAELDCSEWHAQVEGSYSAVVNCVSSAGGGLAGYQKSYVRGQRSILDWCESQQVERYLYTSSTSVYPQDGGSLVDELADTAAVPESGQILLQAERMIESAADRFTRWYVFRLSGIYGPGRHYLLNALRDGIEEFPGSGDHHLNLIHLEDVVRALRNALSGQAPSGVYNLADDHASTKAQLVEWLAEQLGLVTPPFNPDMTTGRVARRGGRMPDRIISNKKAKECLGWTPKFTTFREGYELLLR